MAKRAYKRRGWWQKQLASGRFVLERGSDFNCSMFMMIQRVRNQACLHKYSLNLQVLDCGTMLLVHATRRVK